MAYPRSSAWAALALVFSLFVPTIACEKKTRTGGVGAGDVERPEIDAAAPGDPLVDAGSDDGAPEVAPGPVTTTTELDAGVTCTITYEQPPQEDGRHVEACLTVNYGSNPPSSGMHYPTWPVFRTYSQPVPWGYLVHGLEHGAIVIAYNCPEGCADEVARARQMIARLPVRPGCATAPVIMTPDPELPVRFAASAWGHLVRASCFDDATFARFITEHRDQGSERLEGDCGASDFEAEGWCR